MMRRRLGEYDLLGALGPRLPNRLVQIGFGLVCFVAALAVRVLIDTVAPGPDHSRCSTRRS